MLSLRRPRRLWEISPSSGNVIVDDSNANKHHASTTVNPLHSDLRPRAEPVKHKSLSSMSVKPLTDLPVETIRDIVESVEPVDAICLALTSHRLHGMVLAVKAASNLHELCPQRPTIPQGSTMMLPWLGKMPTESFHDYDDGYGDYEFLMSRLWSWMGPTYIYCGRWKKNYIKRGSTRHVDGDIECFCGWSEVHRRIDVVDDLLSSHPVRHDEVDRALAANTEARKEAQGHRARSRRKTRASTSSGRRA